MAEEPDGGRLLDSPAERAKKEEAKQQTAEKLQRDKYRTRQLTFNGILTVATICTAIIVLYQNHFLSKSVVELTKQSKAMTDTLAETQKQTQAMIESAEASRDGIEVAEATLELNRESSKAALKQAQVSLDARSLSEYQLDIVQVGREIRVVRSAKS